MPENTPEIRLLDRPANILFLLRNNQYFLVPYAIFLIIGLYFILAYPKGTVLLWLNGEHTQFLDTFFSYITWLGDGIFFLILIIPLVFIRIRLGFLGLVSYITSGLLSQIVKYIADTPRPRLYFAGKEALHFVCGVHIYSHNSFPSGHAATAFSLFFLLALITPYKPFKLIFFLLALVVAFSRVYLVQHFFIDIYFGSLMGVVFTYIVYYIIMNWKALNRTSWVDKPLHRLFS